ncbi:MAG: translation initiation factor IF-2 subunit beta [Thermoplasmata archaeon]
MCEEPSEDYDELLKRARKKLPEDISHHERFQVPPVDSFVEGNTTIFRNFSEIIDTINRNSDRVLKYLLRELGTAGEIEESGRATFKGKLGSKKIEEKIENFIDRYVLCSECGKPDTRLVKEDRITILQCDACGAHRPIRGKKKKVQAIEDKELKQGEVYQVLIQDIGREGDGMARKGKYVIYVPGTTKGEMVKVRINNVTGTLAFGTLMSEGSD